MSRTVTAMFDSRPEAEAAKARLTSSNIDADSIRIIDKNYSSESPGTTGSSDHDGFWGSLKGMFMPDEDRHAYGEGIHRGGYLLCAEVDEDQADRAIALLDEAETVDFDERQQSWRNEGWEGSYAGAGTARSSAFGGSRGFESREKSSTVEEEHIPIVEEELRVGKREVERGGARVRSYVREVPVHEQVNLREEHVSVERRPVDQPLSAGGIGDGDAFRDRDIEMTEKSEESVVAKEARVKEEVVVRKTAEEHVENVDDTVRRTEVDVDEGTRGTGDRSAFGGFDRNDKTSETRTDFERTDRDKTF